MKNKNYFATDPFDCGADTCHLAWLFDDNLLHLVANAQCSNGTKFEDLDRSFFADCIVRLPYLFFFLSKFY